MKSAEFRVCGNTISKVVCSGDRNLLSLKDNFSCPIITAEDFLNVIV
ncbi:hypothetical protein GTQ43_09420 [Nostoc sp. KVJ3]|nr:hypothetical protein [Nostoc sp. KVJ3]